MAELDEVRTVHGTPMALVARDRVLRADDEGDEVTALLESWRGKQESRSISKRVRRGMREGAAEGRPHGQVAYGYRRVYAHDERGIARPRSARDEIEPAEAGVIREIADRLIAGESLRRITADLNARQVPSPRDREWRPVMVRHLVTRQRNVGRRVYQGNVVGVAAWPAILDEAVHSQVVALLADPTRKTTTGGARRHLLSGLLVCGVCHEPVRAALNRTVEAYRCPKGHVTRRRAWVDAFIRDLVVARLSRPDAADLLARSDDAAKVREALAEVAVLRSRLYEAADAYAAGGIDAMQLTRITATLRPKVEAAEAATRTTSDEPILAFAIGADAAKRWEALALEQRRAVIRVLLTARLLPTRQGVRVFDPESVQVTWRRSNQPDELSGHQKGLFGGG
jgi:site-specific DNA recombinase